MRMIWENHHLGLNFFFFACYFCIFFPTISQHPTPKIVPRSLEERCFTLSLRFAKSLLKSKVHRRLLPAIRARDCGRTLRNASLLSLPRMRTDSYWNSPIPYFIRIVNTQWIFCVQFIIISEHYTLRIRIYLHASNISMYLMCWCDVLFLSLLSNLVPLSFCLFLSFYSLLLSTPYSIYNFSFPDHITL